MITQMIYKGTNFKGECGIYGNQEREGSGTSNRTVQGDKERSYWNPKGERIRRAIL